MASACVSNRFTDREHNLQDPPLCFVCDEGGGLGGEELIFCDGPCSRHFHRNEDDLELPLTCPSLHLSSAVVRSTNPWYCKDCVRRVARCFICNKEGNMDFNLEHPSDVVYQCGEELCVRFYHLGCVEKDLKTTCQIPKDAPLPRPFTCCRHFCYGCMKAEDGSHELIRYLRCPKAWHDECYKEKCNNWWRDEGIGMFTTKMEKENGIETVWKCVYCYDHKIEVDLGPPAHDHYD